MALSPKVQILRQIISELRRASSVGSLSDNSAFRYIISQFRKYQTSSEQLCKAQEEMEFLAKTYVCYLKSSRLHRQISDEYHGKGERSIAETAKIVGFKLPQDPK